MREIVLATRNQHKIEEIAAILTPNRYQIMTLKNFMDFPEVVEDQDTFAANATKKAQEVARFANMIALADDSGLVVKALEGAPGVYSARFAGEEADDRANNEKLLHLMKAVPLSERGAYFACVIAVATPEGQVWTTEGRCYGSVGFSPRGIHGFGYDSLFIPVGRTESFAEIAAEEKNKISHRAEALAQIPAILNNIERE